MLREALQEQKERVTLTKKFEAQLSDEIDRFIHDSLEIFNNDFQIGGPLSFEDKVRALGLNGDEPDESFQVTQETLKERGFDYVDYRSTYLIALQEIIKESNNEETLGMIQDLTLYYRYNSLEYIIKHHWDLIKSDLLKPFFSKINDFQKELETLGEEDILQNLQRRKSEIEEQYTKEELTNMKVTCLHKTINGEPVSSWKPARTNKRKQQHGKRNPNSQPKRPKPEVHELQYYVPAFEPDWSHVSTITSKIRAYEEKIIQDNSDKLKEGNILPGMQFTLVPKYPREESNIFGEKETDIFITKINYITGNIWISTDGTEVNEIQQPIQTSDYFFDKKEEM